MSEFDASSACRNESKSLIEGAIREFELAWHQYGSPKITSYLPEAEPLRSQVLGELVFIDIEFRQARGEALDLGDYSERYPQLETLLERFEDSQNATPIPIATPADASVPVSPPPDAFGRYRLLREIGCGGMGTVYLAHDTVLDRKVALKTPRLHSEATHFIDRFYREARLAATLRNPHICRVLDVGECDGRHYITMDYIEGETLSAYIDRRHPLPQTEIAIILRELAQALSNAHESSVIHRDLKSGNVMIDRDGEPIVMDFGLAILTTTEESRLTFSGMLVGTPPYMSPEQVEGGLNAALPATDIYALGVILYELLTGHVPFRGTLLHVLRQIGADLPQPPSELRTDTDAQLEDLCLRMLAKAPANRPPSMDDVIRKLEDYLATADKPQPVRARRRAVTSTWNRKPVFLMIGVAVLLLLGLFSFLPRTARIRSDAEYGAAILAERFDAIQAKNYQLASAKSLGVPAQRTNSLGMSLVLIPAGPSTEPFYIGATEVTQHQYESVMGDNPSLFAEGNEEQEFSAEASECPVERVSFVEAEEFCRRLSQFSDARESGLRYRLPSNDEWVFACRAGSAGVYAYGDAIQPNEANYDHSASFKDTPSQRPALLRTAMVGSFLPNGFGLYDMHGNVSEYCTDPLALRGGAWCHEPFGIRLQARYDTAPTNRNERDGFRVVAVIDERLELSQTMAVEQRVNGGEPPLVTLPAQDHFSARQLQEAWAEYLGVAKELTNSVGMRFVLIPPTADIEPFYLGAFEVTQGEFETVLDENPSCFTPSGADAERVRGIDTRQLPVEMITREDADWFCRKLSGLPQEMAAARHYQLPTSAQWLHACRAGALSKFNRGARITPADANFRGHQAANAATPHVFLNRTTTVGSYPANAWGLFDMHGNVAEFCTNPDVLRGGHWSDPADNLRSTRSRPADQYSHSYMTGIRVAFPVIAEQQSRTPSSLVEAATAGDALTRSFRDHPTLAVRTFDAAMAAELQREWSEYYGVPIRRTNSLGMELTLLPAAPGIDPFYLGTYEVTQAEYQEITGNQPSGFSEGRSQALTVAGTDTSRLPVESLTLDQAVEFCRLLNEREAAAGGEITYRLPTALEWEFACRAGTATRYNFGDTISAVQANFNAGVSAIGLAAESRAHFLGKSVNVGSYSPNAFGLYDMHGNVSEFCTQPNSLRGGSWDHRASDLTAGLSFPANSAVASIFDGIRIAATISRKRDQAMSPMDWRAAQVRRSLARTLQDPHPSFARLPFDAGPAADMQSAWAASCGNPVEVTNSIGMQLRCVPASEQTPVFYAGIYEVTQQQFQEVMLGNPSYFSKTGGGAVLVGELDTGRFPVESVTLQQAEAFCQALSELPDERKARRFYRLPTNAEWKFAARAGSAAPFAFGAALSSSQANFNGNQPAGDAAAGPYLRRTTTFGSYSPNAFGLYDMHGNVTEMCIAPNRLRGGSWAHPGHELRCQVTFSLIESRSDERDGFRVVMTFGDD